MTASCPLSTCRWTLLFLTSLSSCLVATGCKRSDEGAAAPVPVTELTLKLAYGSEKKTWLEEELRAFEATQPKSRSGKRIRVKATAMGSGEALQEILSGRAQPDVFSPASAAYLTLLNDGWMTTPGHTRALCPPGEPLVLSPVVIAMWKPMAEALGWPGKALGWTELLKVDALAAGWGGFGHPEWGKFKLGHTHPEFSNSGLLAVLAEAYAGAKKTRGLSEKDLKAEPTQAFIRAVERTIVHYGKSTGFFSEKMLERGPSYLSAAVLYENLVVESYLKPSAQSVPMVALYPREGTFWSDHPYSVLDAPWVDDERKDAAAQLLAFLKAKPAQLRALALGFRPADASVAMTAPLDAAHGVDPKQPQTLLEVPEAPILKALLATWQVNKRHADVELVFDKSGSMEGQPLREAQAGAEAFLRSLHDEDQASLLVFDSQLYLYPAAPSETLATGRARLLSTVRQLQAGGGTALYDAVERAYQDALGRAQKDPRRIHAVVVMTDGQDESSHGSFEALRTQLRHPDAPVKVFTIAYGNAADPTILAKLADAADGSSVRGNSETIVQVYQDMASFF